MSLQWVSGEAVERNGFIFAEVQLSPDAVRASGDHEGF